MKAENIRISRIEPNKGQVEGLPKNPRKVRKSRLDALVRSIEDAPEMLSLRELIVVAHGDRYVVVGGNMRLKALKRLGCFRLSARIHDLRHKQGYDNIVTERVLTSSGKYVAQYRLAI